MGPLISVIIPVYKVEEYLDRCVSSVLNQTYKNLEMILVDDGSPDRCPELCDEWGKKDLRIKVIHKENGGLSDARNAGMKICTGELVAFLDSDDWIHPDFYQTLFDAMVEFNCDIAECDYIKTSGNKPENRLNYAEPLVCETDEAMKLHIADKCFKQVVWNKLYKKELLTAEFEKGKYNEDVFWTYQIIAGAKKLVHVHSEMLYYFQRSDSIMGETYSIKRLDGVEGEFLRCRYIKNQYPDLYPGACISLWFTCLYHGQKAIKYLKKTDYLGVLLKLHEYSDEHVLTYEAKKRLSLSYKVWWVLYRISFLNTCRIRNFLKIGC